MKIAIISDVHSNSTALRTTLIDIEQQGCGRVICLGDIVGYGYDPNGCIDICRERNTECFLGNHDAGLVGNLSISWFNSFAANAILRQRVLVTEENKNWLRRLPYSLVEHGVYNKPTKTEYKIAFVHGELISPKEFDYINGYLDATLEFSDLIGKGIRVLFVGHTHYANIFTYGQDDRVGEYWIDLDDEVKTDLGKWKCSIVNVGSVGYPRNQPYSIYGIYDTRTHVFKHRILPFDFDDYIQRMSAVDAEIPLWIQSQKKRAEESPIGFR